MRLVIVPNELRDAINGEIDQALAGRPMPESEREDLYRYLLSYYDECGSIPSIQLQEKTPAGEPTSD